MDLFFSELSVHEDMKVFIMDEIDYDEFCRRSLFRTHHHGYITSVLKGDKKKLEIYNYTYEVILNKVQKLNVSISQNELVDIIR